MKPVIHMHVPKTGGTYINHVFTQALGAERSACHIAYDLALGEELALGRVYFSSHLPLLDFLHRLPGDRQDFFVVGSFRHPVKQLASHIHWLDHFTQPGYEDELCALPTHIRQEILSISQVDFADPKSLESYLGSLSPVGISLFDNVQTRYLARSIDKDFYSFLQTPDLDEAIHNASLLNFVLFQESLDGDVIRLAEILDISISTAHPQNVSKNARRLDTENPDIVTVLEERLEFDLSLYGFLTGQK